LQSGLDHPPDFGGAFAIFQDRGVRLDSDGQVVGG
jgi:hypothetical protein